jgi:hypothetical protein
MISKSVSCLSGATTVNSSGRFMPKALADCKAEGGLDLNPAESQAPRPFWVSREGPLG